MQTPGSGPNPQDPDSPLYDFIDTQPPSTYPNNPDSSYSHFTVRQRTPEAITNTWPIRVTITDHGFIDGNIIRATKFVFYPIANATGMQELNNKAFMVQQCTANEFSLYDIKGYPIDGTNFTPYVQGGEFTLMYNTPLIVNPSHFPPPGVI